MATDLWLYCNPTGNILTNYYENQIRQGDSFKMRICFPYDEKDPNKYANKTLNAKFQIGSKTLRDPTITVTDGEPKVFAGMGKDNRNIGYLIKGKTYMMYEMTVSSDYEVTAFYGRILLSISISPDSKTIGPTTLNVQKTYGNDARTYITPTEYDKIIDTIEKYAVVAKNYMNLETDIVSNIEDNFLVLKSWSGLGFINGIVKFKKTISSTNEEFTTIASVPSSNLAKLKYPATVMGVICNTKIGTTGTDVQFRLDNEDDYIVLKVSNVSQIYEGDEVAISGCAPYDGDALKFVDKLDGTTTTESVTISGLTCDVTTYTDNSTPSCSYTLERKEDVETGYLLKFTFKLPRIIGDTIKSFEEISKDGRKHTYRLTTTNGLTSDVVITDGKDGSDGKDGKDGSDGIDGSGSAIKLFEESDVTIGESKEEIIDLLKSVCNIIENSNYSSYSFCISYQFKIDGIGICGKSASVEKKETYDDVAASTTKYLWLGPFYCILTDENNQNGEYGEIMKVTPLNGGTMTTGTISYLSVYYYKY